MSPDTVLLTGATGFIGSHLARRLAADGRFRVLALVRGATRRGNVERLLRDGAVVAEGEFHDPSALEDLFARHRVSAVVHAAAIRGGGKGSDAAYERVNVAGTQALLEASRAHGVRRFVHCSSVGVFGTVPARLPAGAGDAFHGDTAYHRSKIAAEERVREATARGLDAYIVRPTITYGPGDDGFPSTLVRLVRKRLLPLPARDIDIHLLDVATLADVFVRLLEAPAPAKREFIAADAAPVPLRRLATLIHRHWHGSDYPAIVRVPAGCFTLGLGLARLVQSDAWTTRLQLLSSSWHYDVGDLWPQLQVRPGRTEERFVGYLGEPGPRGAA